MNNTPLNPYPLEAMPKALQEIITEAEKNLNYPVDFTASGMLFAASVAMGNAVRLYVKNGWEEGGLLIMAIVGKPNTNKTHPIKFAIKPIQANDAKEYATYREAMERWENANENERSAKPPVWKKTFVSDFTPEALMALHEKNPRGMGVHIDELVGWFKNFNRYHQGNEQEMWLSIWNNGDWKIDRKTGKPIYVPRCYIPVIGTMQPSMLFEMSKNNRGQNGFIDRMLFAFPEELEKPYPASGDMNPESEKRWHTIIANIQALSDENPCLIMAEDAKQALLQWEIQNTDECRALGDNNLAAVYGKFDMQVRRLALILETLNWSINCNDPQYTGGNGQVTLPSVQNAIKLAAYYKYTSRRVYEILTDFNPLDKLSVRQKEFYDLLPPEFYSSNLQVAADSVHITMKGAYDWIKKHPLIFERIEQNHYRKIA